MIALCEKYPDIRFIFAHIGRAYFLSGIKDSNLDEFVQFPNAYFDTAMLNHQGVFKYTFPQGFSTGLTGVFHTISPSKSSHFKTTISQINYI